MPPLKAGEGEQYSIWDGHCKCASCARPGKQSRRRCQLWMLFLFSDHFTHNYKSRHWPWLTMIQACGLIAGKNRFNIFFPSSPAQHWQLRPNLWPSGFVKLRIADTFFEPPECCVWINCWGLGRLTSLQYELGGKQRAQIGARCC